MKVYITTQGKKIMEVRPEPFDDAKEIEVADGIRLLDILTKHYYVDGELVETTEIAAKAKLVGEELGIRNWLVQNDWVPNKVITGEWTDKDFRWEAYLKERKAKRARLDEIKTLLG